MLDDFSALMKKTENRKGIILRGKSYYQKLLDIYAGQSYITMASLDLPEQKNLDPTVGQSLSRTSTINR